MKILSIYLVHNSSVAYYNKNEFILAAIHPFDKTVRPQVLTKNHNFSYLKLSCL